MLHFTTMSVKYHSDTLRNLLWPLTIVLCAQKQKNFISHKRFRIQIYTIIVFKLFFELLKHTGLKSGVICNCIYKYGQTTVKLVVTAVLTVKHQI